MFTSTLSIFNPISLQLFVPRPPEKLTGPEKSKRLIVRKLKPQSELDKPPTKTVLVAKPAPPSAPLKSDDFTGEYFVQPRYSFLNIFSEWSLQ